MKKKCEKCGQSLCNCKYSSLFNNRFRLCDFKPKINIDISININKCHGGTGSNWRMDDVEEDLLTSNNSILSSDDFGVDLRTGTKN